MSSDWRKEYPVYTENNGSMTQNTTGNVTDNVTDNVTGAPSEEGSARHPLGAVKLALGFALVCAFALA
eukprot:CAMPEP_0117512144 /NCGR_PEP_ID=MMETSP0784-20121206/28881_1 /TAXON_ID=39447 /ORGANISM="" /LENGTH=67 /DNA_ID=CAMNT_0005307857 /DNA_START=12 /DNA_END=215 /DNA_ORIENTATION=-